MNDTDQQSDKERAKPANERDQRSDDAGRPGEDSEPLREIGGRKGLDPVRYGDWEKNGRCIDF